MTHNPKDSQTHDSKHINMHEQWQIIYWTRTWGINEEQLRRAWKHAQSSSSQKIYEAAVFLRFIKPGAQAQ